LDAEKLRFLSTFQAIAFQEIVSGNGEGQASNCSTLKTALHPVNSVHAAGLTNRTAYLISADQKSRRG
jgi:hypothetical protein